MTTSLQRLEAFTKNAIGDIDVRLLCSTQQDIVKSYDYCESSPPPRLQNRSLEYCYELEMKSLYE